MKIIKNTIKTLRFQRLDNEGEPITSTPEELRVVIKKDDHATASIVKTLSNGDIKWTESDLSWFFTIETPETGHLELGAYGLRVFETVGGVEYQVYETEMRVVELYSDPGDDKKYPSPSAGINFYQAAIRADDESDARGIFCGTVTNGDLFPTTRPDGTPLQNEDYARPDSNSTFPFDVENVTFSSIRDKAYYINGVWMLDAGALQDTSETPLKDRTAESLSGTATNQKVVNVENKNVIEDIQEDIEELEENKVDKTSTAFQAYATDSGGSQTTITYNSASSANTIVKRDGDGRFEASAPVSDLQVSNKKYVDDEVIKKVKDVKLDGSSIVNTDKEALLTKTNIINSIKDESKTFTNTTLDIDSNTLSNVEVDNFKGSAVATTISTSATNNKLATEKAVKDYADGFAKSIARDSTDLKLKDANNNVLSTVTGDDLQTCTKDVTATLKNKTLDFNDNNCLNNFEDNTTIIKDADSKLSLNKDNDTIQYDATNKIFARNFKEVSTFVGETGKSHVLYYLNSNISGYNKGMYKWDATNNVFAPIATNGELGGFVGYVDNTTASLPTTRPSGATLQEGDFMLVSTSSTFPFTIGGMTSTNRNDLFIYKNNAWSIRDGQDVLIEVTTLPTSGIKTNVVYRLNDNGKISYHTYYSGEWRKIIDDETLKEYLRGFKFVGYVSTSEPTGTLRKDELWYNSVSGTMPTVFPINVKRYDGTTWSTTTEEYTPTSMDLWSNKNNDKGYYWFGNSWNIIDTTVEVDNVTTELNSYGQIQIKDSGVSTTKIADAAVTKAKIATDAKVVYEEDTQTLKNKTIDADDNTISDITGANLKAQTTSDAKKTWVVQSDGSWALGKAGSDVDDITIEEVSDKLQVKDSAISDAKLSPLVKSTAIPASGAVDTKLATEKAVKDFGDTKITQYSTMPNAGADYENKIVQFIGTTTLDFINGYFYKCVLDTSTTPFSYKWVRKVVQNDSYDNTTIGRNSADEYYVKDNCITKAKLDTNLISDSIPTSGSGSPDKLTTENAVVNYTQAIFDLIYPVGSYYFGNTMPAIGSWEQVTGDKAIWIKSGTADGTNITQALPKPTVSSTFTGSSATTNSTGSHTHTFTGTSGTTSSNGAHTHSRGTMEITGTLGSICNQGGTSSGAFTYKRDNNAELSGDNQSRGTWTFTASKNWTGETSSDGSHTHTLTPAGSNANSGSHSHTVTAKGSVTSSVNTAGVYGDGTKVQPDAVVMTVWKRTA